MLARLEIADFRNLAAVRLDCAPGLNLISGDNAAGKTSLLEAVYLLGRARSFRTQRPAELIRRGAAHWRLVARLGADGSAGTLGLQRDGAQFTARLNGAPLPSLAELARVLPVLLLTPDSHRLLDDGPRPRRRFLDWGVFQRDAGFLAHWRRCQLALRQRNAALRQPAMLRSLPGWEAELVSAAGPLDAARAGFVEALAAAAQPQLQALLDTDLRLTLDYRRGWPAGQPLGEVLAEAREGDRRAGHTRHGAHRADFAVRLDGRPPGEALSRGQHKLLVAALVLAQAALYRETCGRPCVLLVDDLPAELDGAHRSRFVERLAATGAQVFVTAIEAAALGGTLPADARLHRLAAGALVEVV
ncbi:DNA replication/repair protein RecF [Plasticicumulans sp.]|uniref:DNA replication/repair protein RecF n=2 Tax=Plasticicumulans sp. TaxID=2307179 RepID=UPI003220661F